MSPDETFQTNLRDRYRNALARYTGHPFAVRHRHDDIERELEWTEHQMREHPPYHKNAQGVWLPRLTGATEESQMQAGELPELEFTSFAEADLKLIPEREWSDIINDPNRTPPSDYCPFTQDQNGYGSCGAEGSVGGMRSRRVANGLPDEILNPLMVYHTTSGGRDGGSNPLDNLKFLQKYGCASEKIWPRSKGFRATPDDAAYEDALQYRIAPDGLIRLESWAELATCLLLGFACPLGYSGHWIFGTDLISTTRLRYKNSWGNWGEDGFGTLSKNSVYWSYRVWACTSVVDSRRAA